MEEEVILDIDGVRKYFGGVRGLDGFDIQIKRGKLTGLIGPNGAGKSTLFNVITGVHSPDGGEITYKGDDITEMSPIEALGKGIGRTFQTPHEFGSLTVLENCLFAPRKTGESFRESVFRGSKIKKDIDDIISKAMPLLAEIGLKQHKDKKASELNIGQRKLLEIARVAIVDPDILLLDEPLAGVPAVMLDEALDFIKSLNRDKNITILLIEHKMDAIMEISEEINVMHEGKLLTVGRPEEIEQNEEVREVYLGY